MVPNDKWATRGSICDIKRQVSQNCTLARVWQICLMKPITDSISSLITVYYLIRNVLKSNTYGWVSFLTPIMGERHFFNNTHRFLGRRKSLSCPESAYRFFSYLTDFVIRQSALFLHIVTNHIPFYTFAHINISWRLFYPITSETENIPLT